MSACIFCVRNNMSACIFCVHNDMSACIFCVRDNMSACIFCVRAAPLGASGGPGRKGSTTFGSNSADRGSNASTAAALAGSRWAQGGGGGGESSEGEDEEAEGGRSTAQRSRWSKGADSEGGGDGGGEEEKERVRGKGASVLASRWVQGEGDGEEEEKRRGGKRSRWDTEEEGGLSRGVGSMQRRGGRHGKEMGPATKSRWERGDEEEEEEGGGEGISKAVAKRRREALKLSDADILSDLNSTLASAEAGARAWCQRGLNSTPASAGASARHGVPTRMLVRGLACMCELKLAKDTVCVSTLSKRRDLPAAHEAG